jgi:uncharacterized protein (DUF1015 family)
LADVKPFVCCRPVPALAPEVAALPYDVFSRSEAAAEIAAHPRSFLRIDKTAALFPSDVDEYDEQVYSRAAELLAADTRDGVYLQEDEPHYFLYRLVKDGHAQTGVVACIAVKDYESGVLKRHENTRAFKLEDRVKHITALDAQTGPVLVAYRAQEAIDAAVSQVTAGTQPLYDFVAPDGVQHTVWRVDDRAHEDAIRTGFAALDALYIADGHHRAAAAARIGTQKGGEAGHFLIVAFPSNQLTVLDYNRVVFDTNGLSRDGLLALIAQGFDVEEKGTEPYRPQARGEFSLYLDGTWYRLTAHVGLRPSDPVAALDVSLLQDRLLAPILGIDDPRSSKRIAYVGGVRGLDGLARRADAERGASAERGADAAAVTAATGATGVAAAVPAVATAAAANASATAALGGVAFALFPCSLDELFMVADASRLMPPKSTWFEPKPRSGLFIHRIGD